MSQQTHRSDPAVLNRRTLEQDHRVLAALLRPGMSVLDVGCGTGAITTGIARAVAPGEVVGIDRDGALLPAPEPPNLRFEAQDALAMEFEDRFDVVTAARAVQWMADPASAIERMAGAVKPGGLIVVLDYNHEANSWVPDPPADFLLFYERFLAWRAANGWDNAIADRLPALFGAAGLDAIESRISDEVAGREDAGAAIWLSVIESIGPQLASEEERNWAYCEYENYVRHTLERQTLSMRTVVGRKAL
jgi:SAM-dependent methyltransferase